MNEKTSKKMIVENGVAQFHMDLTLEGGATIQNIKVNLSLGDDLPTLYKYVAGGQSGRVAMQRVMRTLPMATLQRLRAEGLNIKLSEIEKPWAYLSETEANAARDREVNDALKGLSQEAKRQMLEKLLAELE